MCCFWRQKSKGRATDSHPQGCCSQREGAVWVRVHLCVWFVAVCATVSVSDGVHGFIGHSVVFFFFFNNKVSFLLLLSVSLYPLCGWVRGKAQGSRDPFKLRFTGLGAGRDPQSHQAPQSQNLEQWPKYKSLNPTSDIQNQNPWAGGLEHSVKKMPPILIQLFTVSEQVC